MRTAPTRSDEQVDRRALWWRWLAVVSAGELVGFTVPVVVGVWSRDMSGVQQVSALMAAGLVEGALLGLAQALVLRRVVPGLRAGAWVRATSVAAAFAYLLGMLPSTTYDWWTDWPVGLVVVTAVPLGILLLLSIGTAQALVLPPGTPGRRAWVGWSALGWCAGLTTFTAVASPLWHEGQGLVLVALIGLAGGTAMALAMAAVTGVGVLRLVSGAGDSRHDGGVPGRVRVSTLLGTPVYDVQGDRVGRVRDLVADLAIDLDRAPVTSVLIGDLGDASAAVPWGGLERQPDGQGLVVVGATATFDEDQLAPGTVLVRRDILDCPVVLTDPPRRARVSEVVLDVDVAGAGIVELDVSTGGAMRRLVGQVASTAIAEPVRLSEVHLASSAGHAAQLAVPQAMVFRLGPAQMAEVLTRLSVNHAREILRVADPDVLERALPLLHPHVRARVTGADSPPRRTRRLAGWRVHRPGRGADGMTRR